MANEKEKHWRGMYDTITKYNYKHSTQLSNVKITEVIDQVMVDEESEADNVTVDMLSPQRNRSDNLNDLINELTSLTINDVGKYSNGATMSDLQVQFSGDPSGFSHQNLLSDRVIGTRQEEVPVLATTKEPIIVANNQPDVT